MTFLKFVVNILSMHATKCRGMTFSRHCVVFKRLHLTATGILCMVILHYLIPSFIAARMREAIYAKNVLNITLWKDIEILLLLVLIRSFTFLEVTVTAYFVFSTFLVNFGAYMCNSLCIFDYFRQGIWRFSVLSLLLTHPV